MREGEKKKSKAAGKTIKYVPLDDEDDDRRRMNLLLEIKKKAIKFQGTEILKLAKVTFFFFSFDSGNRVCNWWLAPPRHGQDKKLVSHAACQKNSTVYIMYVWREKPMLCGWEVRIQWEFLHRATDWYGRILSESGQPRWPRTIMLSQEYASKCREKGLSPSWMLSSSCRILPPLRLFL